MDLSTLSTVFSLAQQSLSALKQAKEIALTNEDTEILERLTRALGALNDLIGKHGELMIEHTKAKARIEELERMLDEMGSLEMFYNVYWKRRVDLSFEGPFSPQWWDTERKMVRLKFSHVQNSSKEFVFHCNKVGSTYFPVPISFIEARHVYTDEEFTHFKNRSTDGRPETTVEIIPMTRRNRLAGL